MFDTLYQWTMRNGPRLLFAIALVLLVAGLVQAVPLIGRLGPDHGLRADWLAVAMQVLAAFTLPVMPLLGALLINRLDRHLSLREHDSASS
jgi:hypothetical protein